jgi:hypothetical protein
MICASTSLFREQYSHYSFVFETLCIKIKFDGCRGYQRSAHDFSIPNSAVLTVNVATLLEPCFNYKKQLQNYRATGSQQK